MATLTFSILGMSCGHCVAAVRRALESVPGITIHDVQIGSATVETIGPAPVDSIKAALSEEGYEADVVR
jgi:copper chaperone CopZ